jgi:hypothetical protein
LTCGCAAGLRLTVASPAVISATVDARSGAAYTVAGTGRSADLGLDVLTDKLDIPPAGKASVRVINAKDAFPTALVYGPAPGSVLRLVTCGGEFDPRRRHYRDNVVVTAVPAPRAGVASTLEPRHTDGTARNP